MSVGLTPTKVLHIPKMVLDSWGHTATAKSLQSCPTLCDPIDSSPPDSPVPGILQVRILEWVAISCSNACKWKMKVKSLSRVQLLATPWTTAYQAPLSMGFSRHEYWCGVPSPFPEVLGELNSPSWLKDRLWGAAVQVVFQNIITYLVLETEPSADRICCFM